MDTKNISSQCRIILYKWNTNVLTLDGVSLSELSKAVPIDITPLVMDLSYSKTLGDPAGSFSFSLANGLNYKNMTDWKDLIKPGMWCVIMLSQDHDLDVNKKVGSPTYPLKPNKVRCIGYIQRVATKIDTLENGAFEASYEISGMDWGVCLSETTIWHDLFYYEKTLLDATLTTKLDVTGLVKVNEQIEQIHHLFFAPNKLKIGLTKEKEDSLLRQAKQWLLPSALLKDLKIPFKGESYYGNITNLLNFQKTSASIPIENSLDYLSGNAWEKLKSISIPEYHELFTELNDKGNPILTFRPIPWAIDKKKYPIHGKFVTLYKNLKPRITIPAIDVISLDLGEDNHNRKNHYLATVVTTLINNEDNTSILKDSGFPKQNHDSVRRHGFRPIHLTIDSITAQEISSDGKSDRPKIIEYNEVLYDYWNQAVFYETGSVNKIGSNDVKVGITLEFAKDVPYVNEKIYYVESYSDNYVIEPNGSSIWYQTVTLTHGVEKKDLDSLTGFSYRNVEFKQGGEFTEDE